MSELKFIKIKRVIDRVGMSKSNLYAQIAKKRFPAPSKLGVRSSVWVESEVEEWMEERTAESRSEESKKVASKGTG